MRKLATAIGISAVLFASGTITSVSAHEDHSSTSYWSDNSHCEVALNYDITVEPKLLAISDEGKEVYRIEKVAYQNGDKFYLGSTQSSLEDTFGEEFEQEVEQLVKNSIGTMMINLGSEMLSGDGDSFEQKMQAFGQKMENVSQDIEQQMEVQAQDLKARADKMCDNLQNLIALEQKLRIAVPELEKYPLIDAPKVELLE
ncbi:DUF2884 family protein [Shewanella benthica]|uniref:DUF2884 family protein n=1 Tax=Shewanella benthica KT99 TaxID=314608 RepID=A9D257_9GAMM|nr:DUF2884 family protein [Shewanella benthica]EDQ01763.1 hypothetical protein KT99_04149 [Shewanella benthica KT99]